MTTAWARRQKRDGGADVNSCQVQSHHLSSADRQRQSPICETDTCTSRFGPAFGQMFTFSHMSLSWKDVLIFYWGLSSSTIRENSLTTITPPTRAFTRQEGKGDLFPCPPAVSPFFLRHPRPFSVVHAVQSGGQLAGAIQLAGYFGRVSGQRCHSASFELSSGRAVKTRH